jgi:serine/threonine-protein kinase
MNDPCPLADVACCRNVPKHHDPVVERGAVLRPGQVLDSRFLITEILSRGGMATLFKAQDTLDHNQAVVVKVPEPESESDPDFLARFQREEKIGLELNHPFILKFVPVAKRNSLPYIVTEYLRGCTLAHLLKPGRPLPEPDALKIASLLCEALRYLHSHGIIHRDLKPQNVMICCDGTLRVLDFGIASRVSAPRVTQMDFLSGMGTADYIAPERVQGRRGDARTDIYNLGALLYELLTGSTPFPHENAWVAATARLNQDPRPPRELNPELSPEAQEIVLRALQCDPADRYPSAAAMKAALDAPGQIHITGLCDRLRPQLPPLSSFQRARSWVGARLGVLALKLLAPAWLRGRAA